MKCDNSPVYKPYYCLIHPAIASYRKSQNVFDSSKISQKPPPPTGWIHVFSEEPFPTDVERRVPQPFNLWIHQEIVYDFDIKKFWQGQLNGLVDEIFRFAEECAKKCASKNPNDLVASLYLAYLDANFNGR